MKKYAFVVCLLQLLSAIPCTAQNAIISTVAGSHISGYSGDGGPATAARFNYPEAIAFDAAGNMYVSDYFNHRIRKVTPMGSISTFAGTGTGGFSGDGGPAAAARLFYPVGLAMDAGGNLYVADASNHRIRKINAAGIISTVAGNGTSGFSGDGGPASSARMSWPCAVSLDGGGNMYVTDFSNNRIRKITSAGIISTIAGNGTGAFTGDGGPATAASLNSPYGITTYGGDIYIADYGNHVIRKVNASGIITSIAGNGTAGFGGDGGPATAGNLYLPSGVTCDPAGNLYIPDMMNHRIRKVTTSGLLSTIAGNGIAGYSGDGGLATFAQIDSPGALGINAQGDIFIAEFGSHVVRKLRLNPAHTSDSFSVFINEFCSGPQISIVPNHYTTGMTVRTYYGDGSSSVTAVTGAGHASINHTYANSGTYTIRHILFNGASVIDSFRYTYHFMLCNVVPVRLYIDINSNCSHDPNEPFNCSPGMIAVDSNGIVVDSISATSGLNYTAYGPVGTIYNFRVLSAPPGLTVSCGTGVVSHTIYAPTYGISAYNFGLSCTTTSGGYDLRVFSSFRAGFHQFAGTILADNTYCTPIAATLSMQLSPKYTNSLKFTPLPISITGNTVTWNISALASTPFSIKADMEKTLGASFSFGDTVITRYTISPTSGDINTTNNIIIRNDTIKSSFDPNDISAYPEGCLTPDVTELTYTIRFENQGNDTAFNIYVLDTLSANLDPKSMRIVTASAAMNTSIEKSGGYNVIKFDFPEINLLDSSHHGLCNGMVVYKINIKSGLTDGTIIPNRAGIYFDANPVVLTNTIANTISCPLHVGEIQGSNIVTIFPNPVNDELTVTADYGFFGSFAIVNSIGQKFIDQKLEKSQTTVNVTMLPSGLYYVVLKGAEGNIMKKFVKM